MVPHAALNFVLPILSLTYFIAIQGSEFYPTFVKTPPPIPFVFSNFDYYLIMPHSLYHNTSLSTRHVHLMEKAYLYSSTWIIKLAKGHEDSYFCYFHQEPETKRNCRRFYNITKGGFTPFVHKFRSRSLLVFLHLQNSLAELDLQINDQSGRTILVLFPQNETIITGNTTQQQLFFFQVSTQFLFLSLSQATWSVTFTRDPNQHQRVDIRFNKVASKDLQLLSNWTGLKHYVQKVMDRPPYKLRISPSSASKSSLFSGVDHILPRIILQTFNWTESTNLSEPFCGQYFTVIERYSGAAMRAHYHRRVNVITTSIFIEKVEDYLIIYCETALRLPKPTLDYWMGHTSTATWALLLVGFGLLGFLVGLERNKTWESLFQVLRIMVKENVPRWVGKLNVLISFCCIVMHVGYEAGFTSKMAVQPAPILVKDLTELLQMGYRLIPHKNKAYHWNQSDSHRFHYYIATVPGLLEIFFQKLNYTRDRDMQLEFTWTQSSGGCGRLLWECFQNEEYKLASIVKKSKRDKQMAKLSSFAENKYCHFVEQVVMNDLTGWRMEQGRHTKVEKFLRKLEQNGVLRWWNRLEVWRQKYLVAPKRSGKRRGNLRQEKDSGRKRNIRDLIEEEGEWHSLNKIRMQECIKHMLLIYSGLGVIALIVMLGEVCRKGIKCRYFFVGNSLDISIQCRLSLPCKNRQKTYSM